MANPSPGKIAQSMQVSSKRLSKRQTMLQSKPRIKARQLRRPHSAKTSEDRRRSLQLFLSDSHAYTIIYGVWVIC